MKEKTDKLTFIDLFAGCGGLSEGFLQTGKYLGLAHIEWEFPMVKTLRKRLADKWGYTLEEAEKKVIHFDIQKTDELVNGEWSEDSVLEFGRTNHSSVIKGGLKKLVGKSKVDLIIGGPPCQAYSIAGRAQDKNSMKDDYRNYLFESFVRLVKEFKPGVFIFENVPGLLSAEPGGIPVTKRIFEAFDAIDYEIRTPFLLQRAVFDSSEFDVPQKRNRIILIGVRKGAGIRLEGLYKSVTESRTLSTKKTVLDAIGHLPKILPIEETVKESRSRISHVLTDSNNIKYHIPRYHNQRDIKIFKTWVINNMNKKSSKEKIEFYNNIVDKNSKHGKYRNLEWDKPSPTIVAHLHKDGLLFIHPDSKQARTITVKEASLLQSFPDDYDFYGTQGDCYKMIGNAVPIEMARRIAEGIANYYNDYGRKS